MCIYGLAARRAITQKAIVRNDLTYLAHSHTLSLPFGLFIAAEYHHLLAKRMSEMENYIKCPHTDSPDSPCLPSTHIFSTCTVCTTFPNRSHHFSKTSHLISVTIIYLCNIRAHSLPYNSINDSLTVQNFCITSNRFRPSIGYIFFPYLHGMFNAKWSESEKNQEETIAKVITLHVRNGLFRMLPTSLYHFFDFFP